MRQKARGMRAKMRGEGLKAGTNRPQPKSLQSAIQTGNHLLKEAFEERSILSKFKEGENFNRRNTLKYFED
jgi:hypothetical protein